VLYPGFKAGYLINNMSYIKDSEDGIHHLHRLGLIYCEVNKNNIIMDVDKLVIRDSDWYQ